MWIISQLVMPYGSLMGILAVYALSLIYERGGQMGTAIWRVTSLTGNKIANYLPSISIIFLAQILYPELLSRDSTNVDDRDYVPKSKRCTKVQSVITWFTSNTQGMEDTIQGWQTIRRDTQTQSAQKIRRDQNRSRPWPVLAMAAVSMQAEGADSFEHQMTFDTDSSPIRVDNRCTGCISHQIEDFEGPLIDTGR